MSSSLGPIPPLPPEDDRPPRVAWSMYKRFALGAFVVFLLATTTTATAVLLEVKGAADIFSNESLPIPGINAKGVLDDVDPGGPQTILVLGSDQRYIDIKQKNATRSDTLMLIRLDPSKGATAVMSIPRDLKVIIPGHGTDKINAAYAIGGPKLSVKTVRALLQIPINHVVNVNFGGFRRAVNRLGCVFVDVDRRYFNDNNGFGYDYATIDVKAGYQKLCGQDALDYVRYRHSDSDFVRAARQQDFLRQAKEQVGVTKLFSDRKELLRIFARYTQTDIRGTKAILRLLKLTAESASHPVQEVRFPTTDLSGSFVETTPYALEQAVHKFLNAKGSKGPRGEAKQTKAGRKAKRRRKGKRKRGTDVPVGLIVAKNPGEDQAIALSTKVQFPVYYPKLLSSFGHYVDNDRRAYDIYDRGHHKFRGYRIVVASGQVGQYYGIQGTTWKAPPILDNPSEKRRMRGRTYELFFDGDRLRVIAWRTPRAVYWVSNTLLQSLTNKQMLGIARSLQRIGQ